MKSDLEHMIASNHLEHSIKLVGPVRHEDVCQHLVQGMNGFLVLRVHAKSLAMVPQPDKGKGQVYTF